MAKRKSTATYVPVKRTNPGPWGTTAKTGFPPKNIPLPTATFMWPTLMNRKFKNTRTPELISPAGLPTAPGAITTAIRTAFARTNGIMSTRRTITTARFTNTATPGPMNVLSASKGPGSASAEPFPAGSVWIKMEFAMSRIMETKRFQNSPPPVIIFASGAIRARTPWGKLIIFR